MASLSYKTIMWIIPDALFLIIVLVSIMGVILAFVVTTVDVRESEANIAVHRLHFAPDGFSEYDGRTGRTYHGMMDSSRLNDRTAEDVLAYNKERIVFAAKFWINSTSEIPGSREPYREAYLNREKYTREWVIFALAGERGLQGETTSSYRNVRQVVFNGKSLWFTSSVLMPK